MMIKLNVISIDGYYVSDYIVDTDQIYISDVLAPVEPVDPEDPDAVYLQHAATVLPELWTRDLCPDGLFKARYVDSTTSAEGEHTSGAWADESAPTAAEVAEQATAALTAMFESAAQNLLDTTAQSHGYDSINTVVSYADEPAVLKFQNDGIAFRAWRSKVWVYAYEQLAMAQAGTRTIPTVDAFLSELPEVVLS